MEMKRGWRRILQMAFVGFAFLFCCSSAAAQDIRYNFMQGGYGGMQTTTTTSSTINIGTLNIDLYDVAKKEQVWRGEASKTLGSAKDPHKVHKNLNKAVAKLFKKYPPPPKK